MTECWQWVVGGDGVSSLVLVDSSFFGIFGPFEKFLRLPKPIMSLSHSPSTKVLGPKQENQKGIMSGLIRIYVVMTTSISERVKTDIINLFPKTEYNVSFALSTYIPCIC